MSDSFQQALADSLPVLKKIRAGFGPFPTASAAALSKLKSLPKSGTGRLPVREEMPSPPQPDPKRGEGPRTGASHPDTAAFEALREAARACVLCPHLVQSRTQVVFGVGNPRAELMFVGEAPGTEEDEQGEPFVGQDGVLLSKIIETMGYSREEVFMANVLKCRPAMPAGVSGNRKPKPEEMSTCLPWLGKQIALIKPRVLVALGASAVEGLTGNKNPISGLRGHWLDFHGIPVMATYHPAYLLHKPSRAEKRKVWEDMLLVLEKLQKPITEKQRQFFTRSG